MSQKPLFTQINDIGPAHPITPVRHTTDEDGRRRKRRDNNSADKRKDTPPVRRPDPEQGVDEYV